MLGFLPCGSSLLVLCIEEFEDVGGVGYAVVYDEGFWAGF
jgi:hypothetical protein